MKNLEVTLTEQRNVLEKALEDTDEASLTCNPRESMGLYARVNHRGGNRICNE